MARHAKTIFSAVAIAAALTSPAMAQPMRHHSHKAPAVSSANAYSGVSQRGYNAPAQTVYAPEVPEPARTDGLNRDFQLGGEK